MKIDIIFKAIADSNRRQIFNLLVIGGALSITAIAAEFKMTRQGVTRHINKLEKAGLLVVTNSGRNRIYEANIKPLKEVSNWVEYHNKFWNNKLNKLESFLSEDKSDLL